MDKEFQSQEDSEQQVSDIEESVGAGAVELRPVVDSVYEGLHIHVSVDDESPPVRLLSKDKVLALIRGGVLKEPKTVSSPDLEATKDAPAVVAAALGLESGIVPRRESNVAIRRPVDFTNTIDQALIAIDNQMQIAGQENSVSLRQLETRKQQTNAIVDAIDKMIQLSHLQELVAGNNAKFRREDELAVLSPVLSGLKASAEVAKANLLRFQEALKDECERPTPDFVRITQLQAVCQQGLEQMNQIVATLDKTLQLERKSGGRTWGSMNVAALPVSYISGLDGDSGAGSNGREKKGLSEAGGKTPRKLTRSDMAGYTRSGLNSD